MWEILEGDVLERLADLDDGSVHCVVTSPCIKAGTSEKGCCSECGAPWERVVERTSMWDERKARGEPMRHGIEAKQRTAVSGAKSMSGQELAAFKRDNPDKFLGWQPTCDHDTEPVPCTVLDPFSGAGTTGVVALRLGRSYIGIELNQEYADMSRGRIDSDCPLFNRRRQ